MRAVHSAWVERKEAEGARFLTCPECLGCVPACGSACAAGGAAAAAAAARVLGRCGAAEADAPASMCSAVWVAGLADGWVLLCSCASLPAAALDPYVAACGRGPSQSSAAGVSDSHRCSVQTGLKYTALAQPLRASHACCCVRAPGMEVGPQRGPAAVGDLSAQNCISGGDACHKNEALQFK